MASNGHTSTERLRPTEFQSVSTLRIAELQCSLGWEPLTYNVFYVENHWSTMSSMLRTSALQSFSSLRTTELQCSLGWTPLSYNVFFVENHWVTMFSNPLSKDAMPLVSSTSYYKFYWLQEWQCILILLPTWSLVCIAFPHHKLQLIYHTQEVAAQLYSPWNIKPLALCWFTCSDS